jgi:DNA-binding MarR family transcriptional regulator
LPKEVGDTVPENSYPFYTYSGLLTPEHFKQIGNAIWLFLWCISSTTTEKEKDGVVWGIVKGNKPHKLPELAEIFDVNEKTVRRWISDLEKCDYIKVTRAPYGLIFTVKNSKRGHVERMDKNVQSERDKTKTSNPERTDMSNHSDKNVQSNKDITKINNKTTTKEIDQVDAIANRFADLRTIQEGRPTYPNTKDYKAIAQIVDHYKKVLAKEDAKNLAKRRIPEDGNTNKNDGRSTGKTSTKTKSITGNRVGRIRKNI